MKCLLVLEGTHCLHNNSLRKAYICMPPALSKLGIIEFLVNLPPHFIILEHSGLLGGFEIFTFL